MRALLLFIFVAWMGVENAAGAYSAHIKLESQRATCIQVVIWMVFDLFLNVFWMLCLMLICIFFRQHLKKLAEFIEFFRSAYLGAYQKMDDSAFLEICVFYCTCAQRMSGAYQKIN